MAELKKVEESGEPGEETVVVQPRPGVKVYDNPHGMIVVRNFGDPYDDSNWVLIHPDDAKTVADAILEMSDILKRP